MLEVVYSFFFIIAIVLQYNRGKRPVRQTWVFGIITIEYSPVRGYFTVVEGGDAATLCPIIEQCLLPASEVHTDDWRAYRGLSRLPNITSVGIALLHMLVTWWIHVLSCTLSGGVMLEPNEAELKKKKRAQET